METKILPFEMKEMEKDGSEFVGYASTFHNIDDSWERDIIRPGAFTGDLERFLSEGFVAWGHDWDEPIGKPLGAWETAKGLKIHAAISETTRGRDAKRLLVDGVIRRLSIGFRTMGWERLETEEEVRAYWSDWGYSPSADDEAKAKDGARLLTRIRLYELSLVTVPANREAVISEVVKTPSHHGDTEGHVLSEAEGTENPEGFEEPVNFCGRRSRRAAETARVERPIGSEIGGEIWLGTREVRNSEIRSEIGRYVLAMAQMNGVRE